MAEELVVKESLTEDMISAGIRLTERLDEDSSAIAASFWYLVSEDRSWKLIIASPLVETEGPKSFYKRVMRANSKAAKSENIIPLSNIVVVPQHNELVSLLRLAITTGGGISGIRFTQNAINGHFIEDAYIYRLLNVMNT